VASTSVAPAATQAKSAFRPDIEGMRAVAIGLVLVYHAGLPWVPGGFVGVDIFFVISGFLITGLLLREIDTTGRVSLARFYARRAKRLLPATAVVLVATAVLTYVFLPVTDRRVFGWDIVGAATYLANWRFAERSVDYLAEGIGASPVQHFWSLAVEEQFYVVWPILIVLVLLAARRAGRSPRALLTVALVLIAVPSFLWSVAETAQSPASAFFVTTTRAWELAVGAGLALAMPLVRKIPASTASILVAAGLAAIVYSALFFDSSTAWPGSAAAVPVLGAAAVIAGGEVSKTSVFSRLLSARLMVWVGGISYSLYLWHWPLLTAATAHWDGNLGVKRGLLVVALSVVPAWLCHVLVENPVRFSKRLRSNSLSLSLGANFTVVGVLAGLVLVLAIPLQTQSADASPPAGAEVVRQDPSSAPDLWAVDTYSRVVPSPATATKDVPSSYAEGCAQNEKGAEVLICEYGDPDSETVVALVGDSKAQQWQSVLQTIAEERSWKFVMLSKSACPFSPAATVNRDGIYTTCPEWNDQAFDAVLETGADVVITSQSMARALVDPTDEDGGFSEELMIDALATQWQNLADRGIPTIAFLNNAGPKGNIYECVAQNPDALSECAFDGSNVTTAEVQQAAADRVPGTSVLTMNDVICPEGMCPAVMGEVLVYRQGSHLTKTFVDSTRGILEPRLLDALEAASPSISW
jgi:peptidoglycan/LPS O-acetylase OafA/YrhL